MTPFTLFGFTCFEIEVLVMAAMASAAGAAEESMKKNVSPLLQSLWGLTDPDFANFGTAINVAHGVSNVAVAIAADSFGRRKTFLVCLALFLVGGVASAFARNFTAFVLLRFAANLGGGIIIHAYTVTAELMAPQNRERALMVVGVMYYAGLEYGTQLAPVLMPDSGPKHWREYVALQAAPAALVLIWAWFRLPESPVWLRSGGLQQQQSLLSDADGGTGRSSRMSTLADPSTPSRDSIWDDENIDDDGQDEELASLSTAPTATVLQTAKLFCWKVRILICGKYCAVTVALLLLNFFMFGNQWPGAWSLVAADQGMGISDRSMIDDIAAPVSCAAAFAAAAISPRWVTTGTLSTVCLCIWCVLSVAMGYSLLHLDVAGVGAVWCTEEWFKQGAFAPLRARMASGFPVHLRATGMCMGQLVGMAVAGAACSQVVGQIGYKDPIGLGWFNGALCAAGAVASAATTVAMKRTRRLQ